jgi:signal transduction histidine kinase
VATENSFSQFVTLACHDLRTPLATVSGFAHTLQQTDGLGQPAGRYVEMIQAASEQITELLDDLGLVARLEAGRYAPSLVEADTLELARSAASRIGEKVAAAGSGAAVRVDRDAVERGLAGLALCALRHGALERVELTADGPSVWIEPVIPSAAPIVLGEDLKDLAAAAARRVVEALGGSLILEGERLQVRLPT